MGRTGFDHFPAEALGFLRDLSANNRKDWFEANRSTYETAIRGPGRDLCRRDGRKAGRDSPATRFARACSAFIATCVSPATSRLTTPISTSRSCRRGRRRILRDGCRRRACPLSLGVGVFAFEADQLELYRDRVQGPDGVALDALLQDMRKTGIRIGDPELKRPPRDRDPASAPGDLLLRKGLTAWIEHDHPDDIARSGLIERCVAGFERLAPLYRWLI